MKEGFFEEQIVIDNEGVSASSSGDYNRF